jgi:transglutaminase-like putative cysteine protease
VSYPAPETALGATELMDADAPLVRETAARVAGAAEGAEAARRLFEYVRDEIAYEMAPDFAGGRSVWKASETLGRGYGFCQQKAIALAALLRVKEIPAGIVVQDLQDHKIPPHYVEFIGSQRLEVHGLTCAFVDGRWIRLDATLPRALCEKKRYRLVEFDGSRDAVLPETDLDGEPHFDVVDELGTWPDLPDEIVERTLGFEWLQRPEYRKMARRHGPGM